MSQKLPAGRYYIGDPCYVIDDDKWHEFLFGFQNTDDDGGIFDFEGTAACAFYTHYGDGCYEANNGDMLGVDSGIIGAVPMELVGDDTLPLGTEVEFREAFDCVRDPDGCLHFGTFSVMTGDEE